MTASYATTVHVLVLRDRFSAAVGASDERSGGAEATLAAHPAFRVTAAPTAYGQGLSAVTEQRPDLILLDEVLGDPAALIAELDVAHPDIPQVVIIPEAEPNRVNECVIPGARACLVHPTEIETLVRTLLQVHQNAARRRRPTEAAALGRVVTVRGAKGGVGTTVIAANLAVAIRCQTGRPTVLVDANFFGADAGVALNLAPERCIVDLAARLQDLDDELLDATLAQHSTGLALLAAPSELERAESIAPEEFEQVLDALRERFGYVVIDTSAFLDRNTLVTLDLASLLLLVCTPELASLKNAARFLALGKALDYGEAKMRLLVNTIGEPVGITETDIQRHLRYPISFTIHRDSAVVGRSFTRGEPLVMSERRSKTARAIEELARAVVTDHGWAGDRGRSSLPRLSLRLPSLRTPAASPAARRQD